MSFSGEIWGWNECFCGVENGMTRVEPLCGRFGAVVEQFEVFWVLSFFGFRRSLED